MQKKHVKAVGKIEKVSEDPVHAMLASPVVLRKHLLSGALDITKILKNHVELTELRETKIALMDSLRSVYLNMRHLARELERSDLPNVAIEHENHESHHEESMEENHEKQNITEEVTNSEIEQLKKELDEIEKKLKHL